MLIIRWSCRGWKSLAKTKDRAKTKLKLVKKKYRVKVYTCIFCLYLPVVCIYSEWQAINGEPSTENNKKGKREMKKICKFRCLSSEFVRSIVRIFLFGFDDGQTNRFGSADRFTSFQFVWALFIANHLFRLVTIYSITRPSGFLCHPLSMVINWFEQLEELQTIWLQSKLMKSITGQRRQMWT